MDARMARAVWGELETVNAVSYFAPESHQAARDAGLKGFWMGSFAFRCAPMGAVGPGVVEATFYNFSASRVRRAIPDAWTYADPDTVLAARSQRAAAALGRLAPDVDQVAVEVVPLLARVIEAADGSGRPLFAANRVLGLEGDGVEALRQAAVDRLAARRPCRTTRCSAWWARCSGPRDRSWPRARSPSRTPWACTAPGDGVG